MGGNAQVVFNEWAQGKVMVASNPVNGNASATGSLQGRQHRNKVAVDHVRISPPEVKEVSQQKEPIYLQLVQPVHQSVLVGIVEPLEVGIGEHGSVHVGTLVPRWFPS